ncbi:PilZ domain-containing protein [Sphingomonas sp. ID1715]|uniref:PilZ domain-containing protein n=1 Tax=Sphingomonas sp. ID1715 TaxID=1656898 RepID=UPI001487B29F|nr:PilZ domain-containing protein [Sphingomonas sp. ID1715]NNM78166.1 PilZ domain-containing protein [Sphingomonas sp. ID1715]
MNTALAFQPEMPDDDHERRTGQRHISVLRVARGVWEGRDQLCVVRNISADGLMFECLHPPAVGQALAIELRSDKQMRGIVRWAKDQGAGVELEEPINVERMLKEERGSLLRVRPRSPRFARCGPLRLIADGETIPGTTLDISITGLSCRIDQPVQKDAPVVVAIDDVAATNALVRWTKGDVAGISFEKPLPWRPLQLWLDQMPAV